MMTPEAVCAANDIALVYFDGRGTDSKAMFNKKHNVIAIDAYLNDAEKKKKIYHELGHKDHTVSQYELKRQRCELEADRNMIHHLLKDELSYYDDVKDFNYVHFMRKYKLKTIANETMVLEEFRNLIGEVVSIYHES